jgi:alpha-1,6-mannosyltransferase
MEDRIEQLALRSALIYALFLIPTGILLFHAGFSDANISHLVATTWQAKFWELSHLNKNASRVILDILSFIGIGALVWQFGRAFQTLKNIDPARVDGQRLWQAVLLWVGLCGALLVLVVPFHSSDFYGYLNRGFQQSAFGVNPYLVTVAQTLEGGHSPLLHEHWVNNPCPYGFFFAALAGGITALAGSSFSLAFLLFKLLNLLLLLGTTVLIYHIARHLKHERPWLPAFLFGANPLVLLHVMGNGHNDILMVCLLMASLWCLLSRNWGWVSLPLLALSVLTKYASLLALPFVLVFMLRNRQFQALIAGGLLSVGVLALLGALYVDPGQPWPWTAMLDNAGKAQHSLVAALSRTSYYVADILTNRRNEAMQVTQKLLKMLFWGGFIVFYLWQGFRFIARSADFRNLLYAAGLTMTVMVAFVSAKFHPWYVVMFLPLLVLLPDNSRLYRFGILFALFQTIAFTLLQNVHVIGVLLLTVLPAWLAWSGKSLPIPAWARWSAADSPRPEPSLPEST